MSAFLLVGAFLGALLLTRALVWVAWRSKIVDVPNHRSSHSVPTPRGGGVAIFLVSSLGISLLALPSAGFAEQSLRLLIGGFIVAAIGLLDDARGLPASIRLVAHFVAAAIVVTGLGPEPGLTLPGGVIHLGIVWAPICVVAIVWSTNLYNFMDGIDGLAGLQAVLAGVAAGVLSAIYGNEVVAWICGLIGATSAGFLVWNWAPARIFLGDVGSGYLGFCFGSLAVLSSYWGGIPVWSWLILLSVFVVDATVTLLRRIMNGENIGDAHRSHAYQRAVDRLGSHALVVLIVGLINMLWLWPLAWIAAVFPSLGVVALCIAWIPLIGITVILRAGVPEPGHA